MNRIHFTSVYSTRRRRELEHLLFLNPHQHRVRAAILDGIEQYGVPKVVAEHGRLRVTLASGREVQTLFAVAKGLFRSSLAGVMIYTRLDDKTILLLHLAVAENYSSHGRHHQQMLALRLVEELRAIASRVKGVSRVRVLLGHGRTREFQVN